MLVVFLIWYLSVLNSHSKGHGSDCNPLVLELICTDYMFTENRLSFKVEHLKLPRNRKSPNITFTRIWANGSSGLPIPSLMHCDFSDQLGSEGYTIHNGEEVLLQSNICEGLGVNVGTRYKFDIVFDYFFDEFETSHTSQGELFITIE